MEEASVGVRELHIRSLPCGCSGGVYSVCLPGNESGAQHTFQVLTKRPSRVLEIQQNLHWTPNIWLGTSIESARLRFRLDDLMQTAAQVKFLSLEPLLGPMLDLPVHGMDWVTVGGESGPGARPMEADWVRAIRDVCIREQVAFFFKQWGGVRKKQTGRLLDGRIWDQMPVGP